jgi:hypothetical protein
MRLLYLYIHPIMNPKVAVAGLIVALLLLLGFYWRGAPPQAHAAGSRSEIITAKWSAERQTRTPGVVDNEVPLSHHSPSLE